MDGVPVASTLYLDLMQTFLKITARPTSENISEMEPASSPCEALEHTKSIVRAVGGNNAAMLVMVGYFHVQRD